MLARLETGHDIGEIEREIANAAALPLYRGGRNGRVQQKGP